MDTIKILIVDDEADAAEILSLRLGRRKMQTFTAANGLEALEFLKTTPVDIVLLDVKMPGMDGIEVLRHIKRDHKDIEVIMLSGHADMDVATQGLELGAFYYQLKPIDLESLCHKIEDACRQRQLQHKG